MTCELIGRRGARGPNVMQYVEEDRSGDAASVQQAPGVKVTAWRGARAIHTPVKVDSSPRILLLVSKICRIPSSMMTSYTLQVCGPAGPSIRSAV